MDSTSKFETLENTITDLENHSKNIVSLSEAFDNINNVKDDILKASEKLDTEQHRIEEILTSLNTTTSELEDFNKEMDSTIKTRLDITKSDILLGIRDLQEKQTQQSEKLKELLEKQYEKQNTQSDKLRDSLEKLIENKSQIHNKKITILQIMSALSLISVVGLFAYLYIF